MIKIDLKPLSINQAWQGKRFKTKLYKQYCKDLSRILPALKIPEGKLITYLEFGLSNSCADWDNFIKAAQDIISKKYGFSDRLIYQAIVSKTIVKKGHEYIKFNYTEKLCSGCWLKINQITCECE